jgi:hypothetical protein
MSDPHVILGVHVTNRVKGVPAVQKLLTRYGCSIRTRLGLHDVHEGYCSPSGMIVLELAGDRGEMGRLEAALKKVPGVAVKKMVFGH